MMALLRTIALVLGFVYPAFGHSLLHGDGIEASKNATQKADSFLNPVLWEDLADLDVFRVDNTYYYSSSTMHYSPGAPILQSYDLVNWEYVGHSVPTLSWSQNYDLVNGQRAYVKGIWASTLRYRKSNGKWYWLGCIEFGKTYIYTAPAVTGPWALSATLNMCLYDSGLFIDDDDTMYVAYGNTQISVAQLAPDGLSIVKTQQVYSSPSSIGTLEGSRMYKRNGQYYILTTRPANQEWVLKASAPFGSYSIKVLADALSPPVSGGGNPHQGGLVDLPDGSWYYMAFEDAYPGGRIPVLAPVTWGSDGFPALTTVNGGWGQTYPLPLPARPLPSTVGTDSFAGSSLGPTWEWNHNPDTSKFTVDNGLTLRTATITDDLYSARNTLTHRIHGPISTATIVIDTANMADGDTAGLALFRDQSAWIGIRNDAGTFSITMKNNILMDTTWATTNKGNVVASASASRGLIYLRGTVNISPGVGRTGSFSYSNDGAEYTPLGNSLQLNSDWQYFMGYRWGIFNYATKALGGSVHVSSFTQTVSS
ncbi:putative xylosidase glycosyl [Rosellinia necatrix]|uniref:Putative xylosidase glycosyl n=1 Tax=Rosellinia necatrix TaxID=77044 RepID=A0A1W2TS52_ROSNE|nr:putative xylosidase glycosyl [Rosellinia necatrix]